MSAYDIMIMDEAMNNLVDAFDYVVYDCHMDFGILPDGYRKKL